ncbi:serine/threonine-protein kinase [Streptomyces sp. NPDC047108]|uniref:serine/threonine-protein kinase n=1 Tax=Streptomyces sp. NPDC047108 TaxID=3155025 RepID=UPI0033D4DF32
MGEIFAGRYELIDPIGRGGVGAVWRSWDHRRRRYVAAKVLQQSDAHTLLRFVREQAVRIDHPHVLAPASWAADDDKVLFTMDLVGGGSLAHLIGDYGPLPPRYVCTLLDQLLAGLTAVHAEDVVHRDIKPANILLEATGTGRPHLRLSDFGISMRKGEPRLTETNYVVGTPGYFAPEQMMGAEPDFPADLFAVGLVALYLLTGSKPDSQALVEHFVSHGVPGAPEGVPEPLWQVLAGLLQPDPEARFRTATGARKAITAAAEMLPDSTLEEEVVEVFDHLGPLPAGFGPQGPDAGGPGRPGSSQGAGVAHAGGRSGADGTGGAAMPSMSDTGSFHLPPPAQPRNEFPEQPHTPPTPTPTPMPGSGPMTAHPPAHTPPSAHRSVPFLQAPPDMAQAPTAAIHHDHAPTRPYTAQGSQVPVVAPPVSPAAAVGPGAAVPQRRPGPPPKVAIPVLVVALMCFAVGIWALTTS